ncbi:MAG: 3-dehydroquinate synthase [Clostridia bacterium]|nr:3-dehydroquinate synthase [Clostridia bacterium]
MQTVELKTPSMQGLITIGEGVLEERLPALLQGQKNFVITDSNVAKIYGENIKDWFGDTSVYVMPAGEQSKTFWTLGDILETMVKAGLHRNSRVFALGGGVVGDVAGLAAATYMRGVSCVQIPTTLLSQVDSSVGGKTAVDHAGVKNIVGAFYQPQEVLIDPAFLDTLPQREIKCGLGELVKYAALSGEMFDTLYQNKHRFGELAFLKTLILPSVRHKAKVVQADEKESGERKSLNVGHTSGHAIELSYGMSHGECVLWGMKAETKIAIRKGVCEREYGEKLLEIVSCALQTDPVEKVSFADVRDCAYKAKADKKNTDGGGINLSVACKKGAWTSINLPFEEYADCLRESL